jgi:hypothetical protein
MLETMPRANVATATRLQAKALRTLADELEAGRRRLSPELVRALADELHPDDISPDEWEKAWAAEIDHRLDNYQAGKTKRRDLGTVLDDLRARR